jgi:hypothetical protein
MFRLILILKSFEDVDLNLDTDRLLIRFVFDLHSRESDDDL